MSSRSAHPVAALALLAACGAQIAPDFTPGPSAMLPRGGPSATATAVAIEGRFFLIGNHRVGRGGGVDPQTAFRAFLDGVELREVTWVSQTRLTATVPEGLAPGPHRLTVTSPQGLTGGLDKAWMAGAGTPAGLSATASAPAQVSAGQAFTLSAQVTNAGGTDAVAVAPVLSAPGFSVVSAPAPQDVPAQGARTFAWQLAAVLAGEAQLAPSFLGSDGVSGSPVRAAASATVRTQAPPSLSGVATPLPAHLEVGQPAALVLDVTNQGGADVRALQPSAVQAEPGGSLQLGPTPAAQDVPAGATRRFRWSGAALAPGRTALSVTAQGSDGNGAGPVALGAVQWTTQVDAPAALTLAVPPLPTALSTGQTFQLAAPLGNPGGAAALGVTPSLALSGAGLLEVVSAPQPLALAGGATATVAWTLRASQPGAVALSVSAAGSDADTGAALAVPAQAAGVLVQRAPSLLASLHALPAQVSLGQAVQLQLDVTNGGEAAALGVQPAAPAATGVAGELLPSALPAQDVPGGATRSFLWTFKPSAAGQLSFSVSGSGADGNGAGPLSFSAQSSPVTVQLPAALSAQASAPASRTLGDGFAVSLLVKNTGGAAALGVTPSLTLSGAGLATILDSPAAQDLAPGAARQFTWTLRADGAGAAVFSLAASGADANSGHSLSASASAATTLQTGAALTASLAAPAAADVGQTFTVVFTVRNTGQARAQAVTVAPLSLAPAGLVTPLSGPSPAGADIDGLGSQDFAFTFAGASPGTLSITGSASGRDANDAAPLAAAAPAVSLAVDRPAHLSAALSLSRAVAEAGQSLTATLTVTNSGTATARAVSPGALALSSADGGALAAPAAPAPAAADVAGGASASFSWTLGAMTPGTVSIAVQASGTDADSGAPVTAPAPAAQVRVESAPALSATAEISAARASVGQQLRVLLHVANAGQTTVQALSPALSTCGAVAAVGSPGPLDVPGGTTQTFAWTLSAAQPGSCTLTFSGSGLDANTAAPIAVPSAALSLVVQSPAHLTATLAAMPATADVGQPIALTLHVVNDGDAAALQVVPSTSSSGGATAQGGAPAPADLAGHAAADFTFGWLPSAAGTLGFSGSAAGRDANSGLAVATAIASASVQALRPAALGLSLGFPQSDVNLGQQFTVSLAVTNAGDAAARGVQPGALVLSGTGAATLISAPAAADIPGGASATFTWTLQASGLGTIGFSGAASGTDAISGAALSPAAVSSPALTVHTQATLTAAAALSATQLSIGQGFQLSLRVTNLGTATARAVAPAAPQPSVAGVASINSAPPAAQDIPGGQSVTFAWTGTAAAAGAVSFATAASGTDSNTSAAVATSSVVSPRLLVQTPAALSATLTATPSVVNLGDVIAVTLTVSNGGGAEAAAVAPSLSFAPAGALTPGPAPASASIAGGGQQRFSYRFTAAQAGAVAFTAAASGSDANSGALLQSGSVTASVTVQRAASLSAVLALPAGPVDTGQPFAVTMTVQNGGDSTARAVSPGALSPTLAGLTLLSGPTPGSVDLAGGASVTFSFSYSAGSPGALTLSGTASGTDAVNGAPVSAPVATSASLLVQAPAALSGTLSLAPAQVSLGQTLTLSLRVTNSGGAAALQVAPAAPTPSRAGAATLLGSPAAQTIPAGGSVTFAWTFRADSPGPLSFTGFAAGTDANSGAAVSTGNVSSGTSVLQAAAALAASLQVAPAVADVGQAVTVTLSVSNSGGATAQAVVPSLTLSPAVSATVSPPSVASADIAGGAAVSFRWTVTGTAASALQVTASAAGTDVNSGAAVSAGAGPSALTVQRPAAISATLSVPATPVDTGQQFQVTMQVQNTGDSTASLVTPGPLAASLGGVTLVSGPAPADIAGGASASFTWTYTAATVGSLTFSGGAAGTDAVSGAAVTAAQATSAALAVQSPAVLSATLSLAPAKASLGQTLTLTLHVSNGGGADAKAVAPAAPTPTGPGTATLLTSPSAATVPAGGATDFVWTFRADGAGQISFASSASGTDANTSATVSTGTVTSGTTQLMVPAALSAIMQISPAVADVGQTFTVTVTVSNGGGATAHNVTASLSATPAAAVTIQGQPLRQEIRGGTSQIYDWKVTATAAGPLQFSASVSGTDINSGAALSASAAGALTAQRPAALSGTLTAPATVTQGQTFTVSLAETNSGDAAALAVTPTALAISGAAASGASIVAGPTPASASTAGGATVTFTWQVTATAAGALGFSAGASGSDANTGAAVTAAASSAAATVQTPPSLAAAVSISPATVNLGQAFTVTVTLTNSGQAGATSVQPSQFSVSPGGAANKQSGPAPSTVTVPGGGSASFSYSYTGSATGPVTFSCGAQGNDANSGQNVSAAAASAQVTVQTRSALAASFTVPAQAETGQVFAVNLVVTNSGDSAANAVAPSSIAVGGTSGAATLSSGPVPASASVPGHGSATFAYGYRAVTAGAAVTFTGAASGTDAVDGGASSSAQAGSAAVQLVSPAALSASLSLPVALARGNPFTAALTVTNTGGAGASVSPGAPVAASGNTGAASLVSGPTPAGPVALAPGASQTFTWRYTATAAGSFALTAAAGGTDTLTGNALAAASATGSTTIQPPVAQLSSSPPFGGAQATSFSYVFSYQGQVWLGPSGDGSGAVRMNPDGSNAQAVSFQFEVENNAATFVDRNAYWIAHPPASTLGFAGCQANTAACGPDNEAGRGAFFSGTIGGTEWLSVTGARPNGGTRFLYMTNPAFNTAAGAPLDFAFFDVFGASGTPVLAGSTRDVTSSHVFHDHVFAGYADVGNNNTDGFHTPVLIETFTTPGLPGRFATGGTDVVNLHADYMPRIGANGGASANPLTGSGGGAAPLYLDALGEFGTAPNDALYLGNNGGWLRSTSNAPPTCTGPGVCPGFVDITPTDASYAAHASATAANTAGKVTDFEPADKAVIGFVALGGQLFAGRNTVAGPQLWVCTPTGSVNGAPGTQCNAADWKLAAPNTTGDATLSQMNDPRNASITVLAAAGGALFVGYNGASGVQLYRTQAASPAVTNFAGDAPCTASAACPGLGGLGLNASATHFFDGEALAFGGATWLYLTAGTGSGNVGVFRVTP